METNVFNERFIENLNMKSFTGLLRAVFSRSNWTLLDPMIFMNARKYFKIIISIQALRRILQLNEPRIPSSFSFNSKLVYQ
jgi:hypothetical protein